MLMLLGRDLLNSRADSLWVSMYTASIHKRVSQGALLSGVDLWQVPSAA